jgi:hypothetical protein
VLRDRRAQNGWLATAGLLLLVLPGCAVPKKPPPDLSNYRWDGTCDDRDGGGTAGATVQLSAQRGGEIPRSVEERECDRPRPRLLAGVGGHFGGGPTLPQGPSDGFGFQDYPRFHPVPTQPVFAPRTGPMLVGGTAADLGGVDPRPAKVPSSGAAPAAEKPPLRPPEEVPAPPPADGLGRPLDAGAPQRLGAAQTEPPEWLFVPPLHDSALRKVDPSPVELKSDPGSKGAQAKRAK